MEKFKLVDYVGKTPLIELKKIEQTYDLGFHLYAKLERSNPSGSVKDRAALFIINEAIQNGLINEKTTIIEASSGNMGISLAMISAIYGLKIIITMPESASIERRKIMKAYGAEVILTKKELGMEGAVEEAERLGKEIDNSFLAHQFENESNIKAHYFGTGVEILNDLDGKVDVFVAGFGTAGTLSGVSKRLKETNKEIETIGIEPERSPLMTKNQAGPHKIQGIGANFIPDNLLKQCIDRFIDISDEEAYEATRILAKEEGILAGISSGAALAGALKLDKTKYSNKNIVIILPDNGERYLSVQGLYE